MTWYPDEMCGKRYGDLGRVDHEAGPVWEGDLDLGEDGSYCDVEIDWSITIE